MVVDTVVLEQCSIRETARAFRVPKSWVAELVNRYCKVGEAPLVERSKTHRTNPR